MLLLLIILIVIPPNTIITIITSPIPQKKGKRGTIYIKGIITLYIIIHILILHEKLLELIKKSYYLILFLKRVSYLNN